MGFSAECEGGLRPEMCHRAAKRKGRAAVCAAAVSRCSCRGATHSEGWGDVAAVRPRSEAGSEGQATFRLYEELNDFLPSTCRKVAFPVAVQPGDTVAVCLRRLRVPEGAVDLVLVDGLPVGLEQRVQAGSRVTVYPVFECFDIEPATRLPDRPLRRLHFAAPSGLAELAGRLAEAGIDAAVEAGAEHLSAVRAVRQGHVWLTQDPELAVHPELTRVYLVRAADFGTQVAEVLHRFQLCSRSMGRGS